MKPIDAAARYTAPDGSEVALDGATALGRLISDSPDARAAFVERLFHHAVKQPAAAYGPDTRATLAARFEENGTDVKAAFAAAATVAALGPPLLDDGDDSAAARSAAADGPARN